MCLAQRKSGKPTCPDIMNKGEIFGALPTSSNWLYEQQTYSSGQFAELFPSLSCFPVQHGHGLSCRQCAVRVCLPSAWSPSPPNTFQVLSLLPARGSQAQGPWKTGVEDDGATRQRERG